MLFLRSNHHSGNVVKNAQNSTTIYGYQLPANGANGVSLCIKDKWNGEVGLTNILMRKVWLDQVCVIEPVPVYVCRPVTLWECNYVKVGSKPNAACWGQWWDGTEFCGCPPGNCYVNVYQNVCGYVTRQQCGYETQNNEVCTPQYRY